jgi:hypothetical protein
LFCVSLQYVQNVVNAAIALKRISAFLSRNENSLAQVGKGDCIT